MSIESLREKDFLGQSNFLSPKNSIGNGKRPIIPGSGMQYSAYRAIDELLLNIETIGKQKEFKALQSLFIPRMEWTIARLKERTGKTLESKNEK